MIQLIHCACGTEVETTEYFLLQCHFYFTQRLELFEILEKIDPNFLNLNVTNQGYVTVILFYYTVKFYKV